MDPLFRLSYGTAHAPEVDTWFDRHPDELGHLAREWFGVARAIGDDVLELIHDGCPVACVEDVPFCYVNVFAAYINVGFFTGADLPDPDQLLLGKGKRMRHVKVSPVIALDQGALARLIHAAYADVHRKVAADRGEGQP
ncbi:MAG: DUF1801 domain-containing protein [Pseudomonadota bacterium]